MYCCNYDLYKGDTLVNNGRHRKYACFTSVYNPKAYKYDKVVIYVLKRYTDNFSDDNSMIFSSEEVARYFSLLQKIGFVFSWKESTFNIDTYDTTSDIRECYEIEILRKDNSLTSIFVIANCVRYLYEYEFPTKIVKPFLEAASEEDSAVDLWNLLLIMHYNGSTTAPNHRIVRNRDLLEPYTEEQLRGSILENKQEYSHRVDEIHKLVPINGKFTEKDVWPIFKELDKELIFKKYKEICNKWLTTT